jgi:hypothetical protein
MIATHTPRDHMINDVLQYDLICLHLVLPKWNHIPSFLDDLQDLRHATDAGTRKNSISLKDTENMSETGSVYYSL